MVQPIMTSLGRNAKILSSGNRVLSEAFKDNKGVTTVVTRVYDSKNRVLKTRMKKLCETVLKSGKRILTRQEELHVQEKIAGTETPKSGLAFTNKLFTLRETLFSKDKNILLKKTETYKKPCGCEVYIDKRKILISDKLSSLTTYSDTNEVNKAIRDLRMYSGSEVLKLPSDVLHFNETGVPISSNYFNLKEFEIFNK